MTAAQELRPVVAIVQARMGSTRLPGKVLANVGGKPVLAHVLERLRQAKTLDRIVVATTTQPWDQVIVELAQSMGIEVFRGSEEDVLERCEQAAQWCDASTVVRVCGEDVLLDPQIVDRLVRLHLEQQPDYTSNVIGHTFPEGLYIEVFSRRALERLHRQASLPEHREHVTLYILDHPEQFRIESIEATGRLRRPDIKVSVDTPADLEFLRALYAELSRDGQMVDIDTVLDWLELNRGKTRAGATSNRRDTNP
ncbi:MAG: cytidylyltransferase domain-containing protein [Dehalococcoidia bacterium]